MIELENDRRNLILQDGAYERIRRDHHRFGGANLLEDALAHNKTVALVDRGPAGGTCLNVG